MRLLSPEWLEKQTINLKMAACLREIGEHKGRTEMFGTRVLSAMELLRQVTAEHSAAAACRLERSETSAEQANYQRLVLELQDAAMTLPVEVATVKLIQAGLPLRGSEFLVIVLAAVVATSLTLFLLTGGRIFFALDLLYRT